VTAPTPDTPVEVGAGAFIESVPTPAEAATTDAALEAAVLRVVCDRMCESASVHGSCVARARRIAEAVAPLMAAREAVARDERRYLEGRLNIAVESYRFASKVAKTACDRSDAADAEVAAAERRGADLVKGLRKAVKDPATEWVDANIVRLLLDNARAAAGPDTTHEAGS
jgi:hypothetical protein